MVRTPDDIADQSGAPTPTVSVVVPVYNGGRSIRQTLTSVLAQTRSDIEVIVVDDGSTDDTAEIVRTFTRRDSRVRLLRQSNGGVAAARNRGIREARGDFVAPIDADDVWLPEYLERQVAALEAGGPAVTFCYAGFFRLDEANRVMQLPRGHGAPSADYISLLRRNLVGCGSATVFRRDAVLAVGGYDESLRARHAQGCEDWKLILMLASRSTGTSVADPLVGYRDRPDAMSKNLESMRASFLLVIEEMRQIGPRLAAPHFWAARGSMFIWLLPSCILAKRWGHVCRCLFEIYVRNPLWVFQARAWKMLYRILRKIFIRSWLKSPSPWIEASGASRSEGANTAPIANWQFPRLRQPLFRCRNNTTPLDT
jgi:glycosyltransferase involved in cell wall biosynthesis